MNSTGTFWKLVRHEFRAKGSWRKQNSARMSKQWRLAYALFIIVITLGVTTYFAMKDHMQLSYIWYVTMGLPYMIFFYAFGHLKKEWENDTYGWWLTLPYPRTWLLGAMWIGSLLKMIAIILTVFVVSSLYVLALTLTLNNYSMDDMVSFINSGVNWLSVIILFSPFIMAMGQMLVCIQYTDYRPVSPILWFVCMAGLSLPYKTAGLAESVDQATAASQPISWFPYSGWMIACTLVSWILTYFVIRFSAYLLEKKLS